MPAVCGLDWASEHHDFCIQSPDGELLLERRVSHDEAGVRALLSALAAHHVEAVAIERPDGLLVARLLDAGHVVIAMHPNQVAAARDRFRAAAGKSDRFDARVLCELARTDRHRFPALAPLTDDTQALRCLLRCREDLVATRVALANQLRATLGLAWPGPISLFADIDSPIALAFLARYPAHHDARSLGPKRMQGFLDRHGYSGRRSAQHLIDRLRSAPTPAIGPAHAEAARTSVLALVGALKPIVEEIALLSSQITGALNAHPDGPIFHSLFKDPKSSLCAAGLLAEIGDNRHRYPTADTLAADAGMAPVAIESGKHRAAAFRRACDHRLRNHFCVLADTTRHWHPWARDVYQRARTRGADHPHAIRILGRAWTRIIWACWTRHQPYNIHQHRAATRHLTAQG
jgi:transposase